MRDIGGETTNGIDVVDVEGKVVDGDGSCGQWDEAEDGSQEGGFATAALACEADELALAYMEVKGTEEGAITKSEGGGVDVEHRDGLRQSRNIQN